MDVNIKSICLLKKLLYKNLEIIDIKSENKKNNNLDDFWHTILSPTDTRIDMNNNVDMDVMNYIKR